MGKPKEIEVRSLNDFHELVEKKYFGISEAIVQSILGNLKTRKKNIHVLSVKCIEEATVFDITLEKVNFKETLKENLKYLIGLQEDSSRHKLFLLQIILRVLLPF